VRGGDSSLLSPCAPRARTVPCANPPPSSPRPPLPARAPGRRAAPQAALRQSRTYRATNGSSGFAGALTPAPFDTAPSRPTHDMLSQAGELDDQRPLGVIGCLGADVLHSLLPVGPEVVVP